MSYSLTSPIMGASPITAAQIQAWFVSLNPNAPAELGQDIHDEAAAAGLDAVIVAAQVDEETGAWSSAIALQKRNPAGIGAVDNNPMGGAITFPTIRAGIHAQTAHMLTYCLGAANPLKNDDQRYQAAMSAGYGGTVHVIGDLGAGKWASDPSYAPKIVSRANDLVAFAAAHGGATVTRDPQAQWMPSSNFDTGRNGFVIDHITCHITAGTNSLGWLRGAAGGSPGNTNSSATYLIARDGTLYQLVDEADTPYTDGNLLYNNSAVSIEHEAEEGQGFTDAQITASIALQARIAQRQGWTKVTHPTDAVEPEAGPPGMASVIGHFQVPDPGNAALGGGVDHHVNCPGPLFPWQRIIDGVNAILAGGTPQVMGVNVPVAPDVVQMNGHTLGHGFKAFWEHFGGLATFGYPITEEIAENGLTVQWFERARFEYHPETKGNPDMDARYNVMLGLVARELYALTHPAA